MTYNVAMSILLAMSILSYQCTVGRGPVYHSSAFENLCILQRRAATFQLQYFSLLSYNYVLAKFNMSPDSYLILTAGRQD